MSTSSRTRSTASRPSGRGGAVAARQRARRRWAVAGVAAAGVAIVAGIGALSVAGSRSGTTPGYSADRESFDLPALTGTGHVRLSDHRGHPVVVNFFASWCVYCNQELPGFTQVAEASRGKVDFIGVQTQDSGDGAGMAARFDLAGAGFALARDIGGSPGSQLWASFGAQGLPVTAFYDASGTLVDFSGGMLTEPELQQRLATNFGVQVRAADAATLQAPVIPLIPQGAAELIRSHSGDGTFAVIDARTPAEFATGHLEGARNLDAEQADLDRALAVLPKDTSYIVYCRSGKRSATLTARMHGLGFLHLYDLQGGLQAWTQAGLPIAR